jgi:tagatose-1,6-bisphosphate aldolase
MRVAPNDGAHVLEALVQPPKDVEHDDSVFNGCTEVSQTIGRVLELAAVLIDREATLNKSMKRNIKVKCTLLTATEKLVLDGEPEVARRATAFLDHLVKIRRDGVADPVEDDAVHLNSPRIIGRSIACDVLD